MSTPSTPTPSSPAPSVPHVDDDTTRYLTQIFQLKKDLSKASRAVETLTTFERKERESHEETKRTLSILEGKEQSAQDELLEMQHRVALLEHSRHTAPQVDTTELKVLEDQIESLRQEKQNLMANQAEAVKKLAADHAEAMKKLVADHAEAVTKLSSESAERSLQTDALTEKLSRKKKDAAHDLERKTKNFEQITNEVIQLRRFREYIQAEFNTLSKWINLGFAPTQQPGLVHSAAESVVVKLPAENPSMPNLSMPRPPMPLMPKPAAQKDKSPSQKAKPDSGTAKAPPQDDSPLTAEELAKKYGRRTPGDLMERFMRNHPELREPTPIPEHILRLSTKEDVAVLPADNGLVNAMDSTTLKRKRSVSPHQKNV